MNSDTSCNSAGREGHGVEVELLRYLSQHPDAQDTVEGIAGWWLLKQRVAYAIATIEKALSELVAKGYMVVEEHGDGRSHYRLNREKQSEIQGYLKTLERNS